MAKKEAVAEVVATTKPILHDFEIIKEPVITEKSSLLSESSNQYTFIVDKKAGKTEIRKAIERIYGVHVVGISSINAKEKLLSRGSRYKGKIGAFKKAIVTLREGEVINLFAE